MRVGRVRVGGSFLLLALFCYLLEETRMLCVFLLAATIHEVGHFAALRFFRAPMRQFRLTCLGGEIQSDFHRLSYAQETAVALMGPICNFLAAYLWVLHCTYRHLSPEAYLFAGANLLLGVLNLLPIRPLDGFLAARCLLCSTLGLERGEWVVRWVSLALSFLVLAAGIWFLLQTGFNCSPLLIGIFLICCQFS